MTQDALRHAAEIDDGSLPLRWNPDDIPDTMIVGELLRYETIVTDFGPSQIAIVEDEDDGVAYGVALFRAVLKKKFDQLEPRPGDRVAVKYVGLEQPRQAGKNSYHNYVVKLERGTPVAAVPTADEASEGDGELPF